jgi:acetyltransferase EpsM
MKIVEEKIVVVGASGYPEISDLLDDINENNNTIKVIAILDDNCSLHESQVMGVPVVGGLELASSYPDDTKFIFAIGSAENRLSRKGILQKVGVPSERFINVVHPSAKVYSTVNLGYGCIILPNVVINHHTVIGDFCVISANVTIACRCLFGEGVLLGPNSVVLESSKVGPCSYIGAGSVVSQYGEIGPGGFIGIGSVVLKPVLPGHFVMGNPPAGQISNVSVPQDILDEWERLAIDLCKMFRSKNKMISI